MTPHVLNEAPITRNEGREYWHAGRWRSVEAEPYECPQESAQASAEPPLSADTRDTATQSPPVDQSTQADAQTTGGAAGPNVYERAVRRYGIDSQIAMCIEECAELIVVLRHIQRGRTTVSRVCEEIADAFIVVNQMRHAFGAAEVDAAIAVKLARLELRMTGGEEPKL